MVDLTRSPSKQDSDIEEPELDRFPLTLFVSDEEVEKLGLEDVSVEDEKVLLATVRVTDVSTHQSTDNKKSTSITLALTEGEVKDKQPSKSPAEKLFGKE